MQVWLRSMATLLGFLVGSYLAVVFLLPVILPFVLAAILAEVLNPAVDYLSSPRRRLTLPRGVASGIMLVLTLTVLAGVATLAAARLIQEIRELIEVLPAYFTNLARDLTAQLGAFSQTLPVEVQAQLNMGLSEAQAHAKDILPGLLAGIQAFASLPMMITNVIIIFIAAFFLSKDRRLIGGFLLGLLPIEWRGKVRHVKDDVWNSALGFAKAQALLISISGFMTVVGLSWIGAEYAVTVGLIVAVADLLPLLGPAAVYLPWALYQFAFGHTMYGLKLVVLYGLVAAVRTALEPKLVGSGTGLHPLTTLLSMYLGFQFFGGIGFIIGPLLATLLKALVSSGLLPIYHDVTK